MIQNSSRRRSRKAGLSPGTMVHIGEKKTEHARITLVRYDNGRFLEKELQDIEEGMPAPEAESVTWINVDGIHDVQLMTSIGGQFSVHPLTLEDIVNTDQRPKMEDYDDYLFMVLKMISWSGDGKGVKAEQLSLILKPGLLLSFQEQQGDVFDPIRERLRCGKGRLRKQGADYLAYGLIDSVVDQYFLCLEQIGEQIDSLQEELVGSPDKGTLQKLHSLKREMIFLRRAIWPLREVINGLLRGESPLFAASTLVYLRDVYDHTIQVIDTVETFREMLSGMMDIYLSSISNRMNEIMKVLTVIATIFMPLTFIAGVYGMNFKYMPELDWRWGYPAALLLMLVIGAAMGIYFHRKKWV
ncbi:magnesium/cobalt transporter CorA [Desulforhabdus sp. TSK]|uniref:magnesium/cobalt transporter CorA n=1 Tax=Desulforhabdus sp. TSK TaxID=2925014 RepID=UPI001FC8C56F|nr:magnesium/cobalt transporter CorA [Desulforhabdus sp. TSK]GKT10900.1 magnesium transport protein CorA [Desulforhabdus sp. TSK]